MTTTALWPNADSEADFLSQALDYRDDAVRTGLIVATALKGVLLSMPALAASPVASGLSVATQ